MDILSFSKMILEKVSFDRKLLEKEYGKFSKQLPEQERNDLRKWYLSRFGQSLSNV